MAKTKASKPAAKSGKTKLAKPAPSRKATKPAPEVSPAKALAAALVEANRKSATAVPPALIVEAVASTTGQITEAIKSQAGVDLTEKVKELVRLAQEQGYLTYGDINDTLPDSIVTPEDLDEIYSKLRNLEIEIVDQAEVDRVKQPEPEEEVEDKSRLDILDDPVRMYLKQMGQVPLLTREYARAQPPPTWRPLGGPTRAPA